MNELNHYSIEILEIKKIFNKSVAALNNFNLKVKKGEFVSLLGPSGCGKSTLLRIIAGLEEPTSGKIIIGGKDMSKIPANKRPVNMVFQSYSLFPHMNIYDNIAFGPRTSKWPEAMIKSEIEKMLELVGLKGYGKRMPDQLSGGQKQRVAVARALINKPEVLLLDEPLGALDLQIRKQMQLELRRIHLELKNTFIYVTHDQEEALVMSDKVVVIKNGIITQEGTPREIYSNPANEFSASFIGESNILEAKVIKYDKNLATLLLGNINIYATSVEKSKTDVLILLRPESLNIFKKDDQKNYDNNIDGTIVNSIFLGSSIRYEVRLPGNEIINTRKTFTPGCSVFNAGDKIMVGFNKESVYIIGKSHEV